MAYTPTTWAAGDTVTATKLNKLEQGVANASPWDAVIRLTHSDDSGADIPSNLTPSIISGSFSDLSAKISNGEYPTILVQYYHPWGMSYAVPMAYVIYASNSVVTFTIAGYSPAVNAYAIYGDVNWSSSDTLSW